MTSVLPAIARFVMCLMASTVVVSGSGCAVGVEQDHSSTDNHQTAATSCGELGEAAGYIHDVLQCYRAPNRNAQGCGWPFDSDGDGELENDINPWMCNVLQSSTSPMAIQRPISQHRWTISDTSNWRGHPWAILNYDGRTAVPTVVNGQAECDLCLGYAADGIHPRPGISLEGLWQTAQGPMWQVDAYQGKAQIQPCATWQGSYSNGTYTVDHLSASKVHCGTPGHTVDIIQAHQTVGFRPPGHGYDAFIQPNQHLTSPQLSAWRPQTHPTISPLSFENEWILIVTAVEEPMENIEARERLRRIQRGQRINAFRYDFRALSPQGLVPQTACMDRDPSHCTLQADATAVFSLEFDAGGWPLLTLSLTKPIHIGGRFSNGDVYVNNFFGFTSLPAQIADNGSMVFCDHVELESTPKFLGPQLVFSLGFCLVPAFSSSVTFE